MIKTKIPILINENIQSLLPTLLIDKIRPNIGCE